ncbi:hypothetical protein THICB1_70091 [Thiomonas arsenitoxydans]|uniref:Uncharacterized protein n=1 Tax=Thiomonas arsenitoxydans (strain DSM 22701 / CIP 110005 / 3As) TaxID=426114 RepID=A0ABM9T820_THIA3|nr:hypothetical protein THICB1_70091 [Thiomonas arsenitoxydans]
MARPVFWSPRKLGTLTSGQYTSDECKGTPLLGWQVMQRVGGRATWVSFLFLVVASLQGATVLRSSDRYPGHG